MDKREIASFIERRLRGRRGGIVPDSLAMARIRALGDEIGEPILRGEFDAPSDYIILNLVCPSGTKVRVSMPPAAAEKIMSMG